MTKRVGYKSPPRHTQWKPGQSGNPRGRAKGHRNFMTDLFDELRQRIQVTEKGSTRSITKQRALIKQLYARAIAGDSRAISIMLDLLLRVFELEPQAPADAPLSAEDRALLDAFLPRRSTLKGDAS